jgi:hypothetical protein
VGLKGAQLLKGALYQGRNVFKGHPFVKELFGQDLFFLKAALF